MFIIPQAQIKRTTVFYFERVMYARDKTTPHVVPEDPPAMEPTRRPSPPHVPESPVPEEPADPNVDVPDYPIPFEPHHPINPLERERPK